MDSKLILEHELVPLHEIMEKDEIEHLLSKYGITREKLPKIKEKDPVAQAIEAKVGDVLKIIRDSPTAGKALYYRVVV